MTCKEWREGYSVGFEDGYNKAKRDLATNPSPFWPMPDVLGNPPKEAQCKVCGMFWETGKVYGYVCGNSNCPNKVYCGTVTTNNTGVT